MKYCSRCKGVRNCSRCQIRKAQSRADGGTKTMGVPSNFQTGWQRWFLEGPRHRQDRNFPDELRKK